MIEFTCVCGLTKRMAELSTIWDMPTCPRCKNNPLYRTRPDLFQTASESVTKPQSVNVGGRPKKHQSNADKQREYRQRQKALRNLDNVRKA